MTFSLASITFQNFFKLYDKISGMTGTADTEAVEFYEIYDLDVIVIPTNKISKRIDHCDLIFGNKNDKFLAIVRDIQSCIKKNQPVLVGTASIETSEILSLLLKKNNINHNILNAKQHAKEASIIAQAGFPGKVTIATNMAGRGTDIILGGNWELEISGIHKKSQKKIERVKQDWLLRNKKVIEAGGLCILGSERHDSRRIDNQLRGRCGRQGDPGESRFYLSMDDDLLRIFSSESLINRMKKNFSIGESIQFNMMMKFIQKAQSKVEQYHFNIRKNLFEYDNVSNEQRLVIYKQRADLLSRDNVYDVINNIYHDVIDKLLETYVSSSLKESEWNLEGLKKILFADFSISFDLYDLLQKNGFQLNFTNLKKIILKETVYNYDTRLKNIPVNFVRQFEKMILIQTLDLYWREHLNNIDHLRNSINLRGYAQKDPKNEYKKESFELFSKMLDDFKYKTISNVLKITNQIINKPKKIEQECKDSIKNIEKKYKKDIFNNSSSIKNIATLKRNFSINRKIKRNDPCPCGSEKKYKKCHGNLVDFNI